MANLSVRMKKETIDELDRIAELLGIDRATIVRKIIDTGIAQQIFLELQYGMNLSITERNFPL